MKRLVVIRHAEAEEVQIGQDDFDRDLTVKGKDDAANVAGRLLSRNIVPDLIISSPSLRAYKTAKLFGEVFGVDNKQIVRKIMLYGDYETYKVVSLLKNEARDADTVFIVSHNPVIQKLMFDLSASHLHLSTSCAAVIEFEVEEWSGLRDLAGSMVLLEESHDKVV